MRVCRVVPLMARVFGLALAAMIAAHEISEPQALTIAPRYLHVNAAALYR